jgi:hypothetical protein
MPSSRLHLGASLTLLLAACASTPTNPPPTAANSTTAGPSAATGATPLATPAPSIPAGALAMPAAFGIELAPGTYFSSPPFDVAFTFDVGEPGWVAGHLNGEFFDLQRYDGPPAAGEQPLRMVGFGHPDSFNRDDAAVPVAELSARAAIDLLAGRRFLEATNVRELELLGLSAARIDLHSEFNGNPVFGGSDGTFGLFPNMDMRLVVVETDDAGLLALVVLAPPVELEGAWTESRAILESIDLTP